MSLTQLLSFSSVMKNVGGILLAVVILLVMVTIHEFGHYIAGKILGFNIEEFSVGFGPAIFKKRSKKSGELFALRVIPLGGYCAFEGEDDADEEPNDKNKNGKQTTDGKMPRDAENEPFSDFTEKSSAENAGVSQTIASAPHGIKTGETGKTGEPVSLSKDQKENEQADEQAGFPPKKGKKFNDQPPWKRIIVLIAGATMNYLLALVLIMVMFFAFGRPHPYFAEIKTAETAGAAATSSAIVDTADGDEKSDGVQAGDIILKVNGKDMYLVTDYADALKGKKAGDVVAVELMRRDEEGNWKKRSLSVALAADANFANVSDTATAYAVFGLDSKKVAIGNALVKQGFFENIGDSFVYSWKVGGMVLRSLGELLTGKLGLSSMGGPVTTIKVTAQAASYGFSSFLNIASFIGVNLAVFNLLPIPALDGSKVIFCAIEWIRKKPINRKVEAMIHFIGIILLFGFAILVDLLQLF